MCDLLDVGRDTLGQLGGVTTNTWSVRHGCFACSLISSAVGEQCSFLSSHLNNIKEKSHSYTYFKVTPSVQFSCSVMSDSLWPHESPHARPPCPSPTPRVHSNSRPSSRWCHPAISSSVVPFSSCPQSLPASESFPVSQLFAWGGQSTGVSDTFYKFDVPNRVEI